jgi:hypothetical protein
VTYSKLTPTLHAQLVSEAEGGLLYDAQLAVECDVHPKTLERWLLNGLSENAEEPFKSFAIDYTKACNKFEKSIMRKVREGRTGKGSAFEFEEDGALVETEATEDNGGDWRASAWIAERRWPRRYALSKHGDKRRVDALDTVDLLKTLDERFASLVELFRGDMPPELVQALREAAPEIVAALAGPVLP